MFARERVAGVAAEYLGTATLALVVFSMIGRTTFPFFAGIAAGVVVGTFMLAMRSVGGVHLNPAITLGMWTQRKVSTLQAVLYVAAQMLAGLSVWGLLTYLLNKPLTSMASKSFDWRVFIAEGLGALIFSFGVAAAAYEGYKGLKLAYTVGASLTVGILVASIASNGLINPAVALGVQSWDVSYVLAPIVGAIVGMNLYVILFAPSWSLRNMVGLSANKKAKRRR